MRYMQCVQWMKESDLLCRGERREELMSELYTRRPRAYIAPRSVSKMRCIVTVVRREALCRPVVLQTTLKV